MFDSQMYRSLSQSSQDQAGFTYQTDTERTLSRSLIALSKGLKLAVAIYVSSLFVVGEAEDCGKEVYQLYITLLVVMFADPLCFVISLLVLKVTPGCLSASYLLFYIVSKWVFRSVILLCAIELNILYYGSYYACDDSQRSPLVYLMMVLDLFGVAYLLMGCCVVASCCFACTGLTNTNYTNDLTGSYIATSHEEIGLVESSKR